MAVDDGEEGAAAPGPTYPDAPEALIQLWQRRRGRLSMAEGEELPAPDADLSALRTRLVAIPENDRPGEASAHAAKLHELRREFVGLPELALLNGILIAHLRKRRAPRGAAELFRRLWAEEGAFLLAQLPGRWLISSAITFADHGETEAQRILGTELNVLFSLLKLYEFERLHSGLAPDEPFRRRKSATAALPLGMPAFSLLSGGLDINLLAPIWARAQATPVLGPLACHLLEQLNHEPGTLFRRLASMRAARRAARANQRGEADETGTPKRLA